jgi:hypothetical protein
MGKTSVTLFISPNYLNTCRMTKETITLGSKKSLAGVLLRKSSILIKILNRTIESTQEKDEESGNLLSKLRKNTSQNLEKTNLSLL